MTGRYDVRLDGQSLLDISPDLIVTDIIESNPSETVTAEKYSMRSGSRFVRKLRTKSEVEVRFALRIYDTQARLDAFNRVLTWASVPAYLTTSDRIGQRLYVEDISMPSLQSVKDWTAELTMTFTAYAMPYWQSLYLSTATVSNTQTGYVSPQGNAPSVLCDVAVTAIDSTATTLTVNCGNTSLSFAGLSLARNKTLLVGHKADGLLYATIDGASVLNKRSGDDDLIAKPGARNPVSVTANATVSAKFSARGGWK